MEELQDAIEDVQYMNAMHDGIPRPTQEWKWPSPEEFQIYLDKVKTTAPRSFEPEGLCRGSLGFYTVIDLSLGMCIILSLTFSRSNYVSSSFFLLPTDPLSLSSAVHEILQRSRSSDENYGRIYRRCGCISGKRFLSCIPLRFFFVDDR